MAPDISAGNAVRKLNSAEPELSTLTLTMNFVQNCSNHIGQFTRMGNQHKMLDTAATS
jgi:hypothetical protein